MRISPISASSPRRIGGSSSASTTSTRRCRGRSSGTSSGSLRASRSSGRERGFGDAIRRCVVMATVREYRQAMARFAEMRNIRVWYTRLDVAGDPRPAQGGGFQEADEALRVQRRQRAHEGQPASAHEAVRHRRRRAPDRRQSSPRDADRGRAAGRGAGPPRGRRAANDPHLPAHPAARPAPSARELPLRARGPQGRRRRQRGCPDLDPAPGGPRRGRSAVPPVQGSPGIGARAVSRRRASSPSTDSASSRGSG